MAEDAQDVAKEFAKCLVELRKAKGLSQARACELAGLSIDTWSRMERASGQEPRLSTLFRLAKALKVRPADLLPDPSETQPSSVQDELVQLVKYLDAETQEALLKVLRRLG